MLIAAKFNSKCSACGDHITQGELISWTKGSRAVFHAGCSAEGQAAAKAQQASRATDADVELRCPAGLSYLPYQRAGIAFAMGKKGVLFGDEMGLGKQQPVDTKVLTPIGWREIGWLAVGDYVIGSDGRPVKVLGVYPQGIRPSYRVRFSDGSSVEAGPEHLWTIGYRRGGKVWAEMTLTTDELRLLPKRGTLDLSKTTLYLPMLSGPTQRDRRSEPLPLDAYTLGALIANGSMVGPSAVLSMNAEDMDHVRSRVVIGSITTYGKCSRATVLGAIAPIRLLGLDVKSKDKFIPLHYLNASVEDRVALLHGLMDCDGSIALRNRVIYHSMSEQLVLDVQELVEGLGGIASIRAYDRSDKGKGIEYQVRIRCPKWLVPFSSPRKASRYTPGRNARPCRTVSGVEYVRDVESVCIAVDAADQLYVTEHCILTHNTIQLIGWINNEPAIRNALVICSKSLTINWVRELRKWLVRDMSVSRVPGIADVTVVSYEEARKHLDDLNTPWDLVALDEAQNCKSKKSKRTQAVEKLMARATRRATLTGTPMPNKVIELWPLLQMTDPESWDPEGKGYWRFAFRYAGAYRDDHGIDVSGSSNLEELQSKLRSTCMVRRLKKDVLKELPAKRRQIIEIPVDEVSASARAALNSELLEWKHRDAALDELRARVELAQVSDSAADFEAAVASLSKATKASFEEMARIRKACAVAKIPYVVDHARAALEDDPSAKLVIFAHHHEVIDAIRTGLAEFGAVHVDGRITDVSVRQAAVDRFQTRPECRVFVGGILAAGTGLTLTASAHVIFAELDWVPANMMQAEDRTHRIGQMASVLSQMLVLEGSLDARMAEVLVDKMNVADKALDAITVRAPVSPMARPSVSHGGLKELETIAAKLSAAHVAEIHSGLRRLRAACDRASSVDGSGFSKIDVRIGHSLALAPRLTPKQAALGARLCRKYRKQLGDGCWSNL